MSKEETHNKYGDSDRKVEIVAIGNRGTFSRIPYDDIHDGESLIEGRFVYAAAISRFRPVTAKTDAYFWRK